MDCCNLSFSNKTDTKDSLAAVNFFLGLVGIVQVSRIAMYHSAHKEEAAKVEATKEAAEETIKS